MVCVVINNTKIPQDYKRPLLRVTRTNDIIDFSAETGSENSQTNHPLEGIYFIDHWAAENKSNFYRKAASLKKICLNNLSIKREYCFVGIGFFQ